ncbi:MFS transporter [Streptomyces sp. NPDC059740]|uniref:MFS transporter n=1 Tax=Streptomyces sp. NPDC059740 TaxID=3346926 RepID=UPI003658545D
MTASPGTAETGSSVWAPLRRGMFTALWLAQLVANVGTWMQTVGAQWLIGDLGGGPLQIALVQTATTLPVFLLVVPAGAVGDILDRRHLLIAGQLVMFLGAGGLAAVTALGFATSAWVLGLTALMAVGEALCITLFQAIQPELVSADEIPQAALLNSANGNVARAVGPAVGGLLISWAGPEATFGLNALSFLGVVAVLYAWRRPSGHRPLGAEHVSGALRAGARYVRSAPMFGAVLGRSGLFTLFAGALWALLPTVARGPLHLGAGGYGLLLGSVGLGAVLGAFVLPYLRSHVSADTLVSAAMVLYAATMAVIGLVDAVLVVAVALLLTGLAWVTVLSTVSAYAQLLLPAWARTRALAYYQLVFMGAQAIGAFGWGLVAGRVGVATAFVVAGAGLALSTVAAVVLALTPTAFTLTLRGADIDLSPARDWPEEPLTAAEPRRDVGPVLVTVEWRVEPDDAAAFTEAMRPLGRARRRAGATFWGIYADTADPGLFLEAYTVVSEEEHVRMHVERTTALDEKLQAEVSRWTVPGTSPRVRHLVWAYAPRRRTEPVAWPGVT